MLKEFSFGKKNILRSSSEFSEVYLSGKKIILKNFIYIYLKKKSGDPKLGVVVSKKCFKNATDRNHTKRICKEVFRKMLPILGPVEVIVIAKKNYSSTMKQKRFEQVNNDWEKFIKCVL
ncbi:MAG: ribonuclease P protein component [Pseudomonadota bacterium]|nr:ribonuclease P protein component [Pseudomonadota bacterium]